jgi:hypothetical protein
MNSLKLLATGILLMTSATLAAPAFAAQIASHIVRSKVAGIDLIAYPTAVKDVVSPRGMRSRATAMRPCRRLWA